jgi:mRNA interferase HigB
MRIISTKGIKLSEFWERYCDAEGPLKAWHDDARRAQWSTPADVQRNYGDDVILPKKRAVFNIKGNKYRLVVRINYQSKIVDIRFIDTHAEYNRIDALEI